MSQRLLKNGGIWQRGMALLMLVCLSGAACAFACAMHAEAAASTKLEITAPAEDAPQMAGHSCCKRAKAQGADKSGSWQNSQPAPEMVECCLSNFRTLSDAPQKLKLDPPAVAVLERPVNFVPEVAASPYRLVFYQPHKPPDKQRTYLRHCVFLI